MSMSAYYPKRTSVISAVISASDGRADLGWGGIRCLVLWVGGMVPLALTIALIALDLLVAFLQAYVFAVLTCIYLNDALHPGH